MTINLQRPEITELKPRITVFGVGGGGGNAVNNMVSGGLEGVEFVVANTDSQALHASKAERVIQMGVQVTQGLGAGAQPQIGAQAAEECIDEIRDHLSGAHMAFVTAGMGGGTGSGAAPVVARAAREMGILTVGVVTKPFGFEGGRRMKVAEAGIEELQADVDTLIVIPNQNLFRVADEKTTLAEAFAMADQVLYEGVACITDLMVKEGLINLDFADVRSVMAEMGKAMMGTGEASGDKRALNAAEAAIANPLLDETNMAGAQGLLISITGGRDMTLFELDEAAQRIREEVAEEANIIMGATFDDSLQGIIRVSVVATGIDTQIDASAGHEDRLRDKAEKLRSDAQARVAPATSIEQAMEQSDARQAPQAQPAPQPAMQAAPQPAPQSIPQVQQQAPQAPKAAFPSDEFDREFASSLAAETSRAPTMPRTEDFPVHAQREIRAETSEDRGATGLFSKLTRAVAGPAAQPAPQPAAQPAPRPSQQPVQQTAPQPRATPSDDRLAYAPQAMRGSVPQAPLDQHGRPVSAHPVAAPAPSHPHVAQPQQASAQPQAPRAVPSAQAQPGRADDDLEIPAFLRRSRG